MKILLEKRPRQSGSTAELFSKFFGNKNSVFVVYNNNIKDTVLKGNIGYGLSDDVKNDLKSRVLAVNTKKFEKNILKHKTIYLDDMPRDTMMKIVNMAIENDIRLVGHYTE